MKIFSKTLSIRLSKFIDRIISDTQFAFVLDRHISDSFSLATKLIDHWNNTKQNVPLMKLDFEKAFDNVDWHLLQSLHFGSKWCRWVDSILRSSKFVPIVNKEIANWIKANRGLKQEDPLSLFVFILVTDVLDHLLQFVAKNELISSIG